MNGNYHLSKNRVKIESKDKHADKVYMWDNKFFANCRWVSLIKAQASTKNIVVLLFVCLFRQTFNLIWHV